jgi:hypothetical protein
MILPRGLNLTTTFSSQPASIMDGLHVEYFKHESDFERHLDIQLKLWHVPARLTDVAGYWPGLGSIIIDGQVCCSTCKESLTHLANTGPSEKESAKHLTADGFLDYHQNIKHTFECTANKASMEALPKMIECFQPGADASFKCHLHPPNDSGWTHKVRGADHLYKRWQPPLSHFHTMSSNLSTDTTPTTMTPWSTQAGEQFLATGKWFMENPMPALEAASDEHINGLIDLKQKDMIVLLNDVKDSLKTMCVTGMLLK